MCLILCAAEQVDFTLPVKIIIQQFSFVTQIYPLL